MVVHAYNSSYSRGRDRRFMSSSQPKKRYLRDPVSKTILKNQNDWGMDKWLGTCLACTRHWVQFPNTENKKRDLEEKEEGEGEEE
jgi:hypothetical protein